MKKPSVVDFAHQVLDMQYELENLRAEVERLQDIERKYNELLDSTIKHNDEMMGHLLVGALNGAFTGGKKGDQ